MGSEQTIVVRVGAKKAKAKALLETEEIFVRSDAIKLKIPFQSIRSLSAKDGTLVIKHGKSDEVRLELGAHAETWKHKIENPKGRIDKLGVKSGQRVAIVGVDDASFEKEVRDRGAEIVAAKKSVDVLFFGLASPADLKRLATMEKVIARDGSIWTIRAKGKDTPVSEMAAMAAGKAAGLVDVKVMKFSETHTAAKWVIPVAKR
jgi:hypothetical protein